MNLKQLEAFVRVAETKSFSAAAKMLFLTQPTVSAHIASLERELNTCLLIRNTKEVALSEAGKELYAYAEQMLELEQQIRERFGLTGRQPGSVLRIAASTIPSLYLLPVILREEGSGTRKEAFRLLTQMGVDLSKLNVAAMMENQETIKRSVSSGIGISILSKLAAREEIDSGKLLAFPLGETGGKRDINVVYDAGYPSLPAADKFIKTVKQMYL